MQEQPPESAATTEELDPIEFAGLNEPRGLRINKPENIPGYVLFAPLISDTTYLIDRQGRVVHVWKSEHAPSSEYLLDDGHLLRGARLPDAPRFNAGGQGGRIEKVTFEGERVWWFDIADEASLLHHDFQLMPDGNILAIAWEAVSAEDAIARGRDPELTPGAGLWPDLVVEIEPTAAGGNIVWQWRAWDHLIQNRNPALPNYGEPEDNPGRVDINAGPPLPVLTAAELQREKSLNQIPGNATLEDLGSDLHHSNAISYNPELDQIAISVRAFSEIWVIDHATSAADTAGPDGDLLYRWGNPAIYGHQSSVSTGLGRQHDVRWIPAGCPGAGNLMAFSNDGFGVTAPVSQVLEIAPPLVADGRYEIEPDRPYGPTELVWCYSDGDFHSPFISGAHRLSNGNTLVTFGPQGRFVEVTTSGEIVWEYWSPYSGELRMPDGTLPQPGAPFMYSTFRATFIPSDHPAVSGRDLEPLDPQPPPSVLREQELAPFRVNAFQSERLSK